MGDDLYHTRYSVLLEAYLRGCGETMLVRSTPHTQCQCWLLQPPHAPQTMFEQQLEVYTKLEAIKSEVSAAMVMCWPLQPAPLPTTPPQLLEGEVLKEGRPGALQQVLARAGLDRVHFHPPYNQQLCVGHMDLSAAKVLPSKKVGGAGGPSLSRPRRHTWSRHDPVTQPLSYAAILPHPTPPCPPLQRPIWLECRNMDPMALPSQATHKLLVKHGDDLRQDMLVLQALRLMERVRASRTDVAAGTA